MAKKLTMLYFAHAVLLGGLSPNYDPSQISHCNIKGLLVREIMRTENMTTQVRILLIF